MKYLTSRELAERWNISQRRILRLANEGKIAGAKLCGKSWIFPEQVQKPRDGRTKTGKAEQREKDSFRYPLFEYKDETSFHPPLSVEERAIKSFVEAFNAFRFQDAETILEDFVQWSQDRYIRIIGLYFKCMLCMFSCNTVLFLDSYAKLKSELSEAFPHKAEMAEYLYEIDSVLGEDNYYSNDFHDRSIFCYHTSFLPRYCNISALWLALGNRSVTPADLTVHEANCALLDQTDNAFDAQAVHLYLACAYEMLGKEAECSYHFRKVLQLAERYDMFYSIAIMQYYYTQKSLDDALVYFSEELRKKVKNCNQIFYTSHIKFTNALQMNSLYKHIVGSDYLYIAFAVQGRTNKEVAKRMNVSLGTVGKRYSEIYSEFGVESKNEMIALYHSLTHKKDQSHIGSVGE